MDDDSRPLIDALKGVLADVAPPDQVLRSILDTALRRSGAERGVFVEVGPAGALEYRVRHKFQRDDLAGPGGAFSRNLFAEVLETGRGILVENAMETPGRDASASIRSFRLVSVLCLPVRAAGRIAGIVHLEHSKAGFFSARHREEVESLLALASPFLEAMLAGSRLAEDAATARVELEESRGVLVRDWSFGRFVGRAPAVRALEETVRRAAASDWPVLVTGETGTGKGIVAGGAAFPRIALPVSINGIFCNDTVLDIKSKPARRFYVEPQDIHWDVATNGVTTTTSDVVWGDLRTLRQTGGGFNTATWACAADSNGDGWATFAGTPQPGQGIWFLERATGDLYADDDAAQVGAPDPGIAQSSGACP